MAAAGDVAADMMQAGKFCCNCFIFDWKQPSKDHLARCTGCWEVWYCGNMCQKEHWHNSHKEQCKYLSKKKVLSNAMHDQTTCLVCRKEASVGREEMSKQDNPILPCTMSRANRELMNIDEPLPYVAIPEATGLSHTKVDAIIAIFLRILVKMKMTKHWLWHFPKTVDLAESLYKKLWKSRIIDLKNSLIFKKPGPLEEQLLYQSIDSSTEDVIYKDMLAIDVHRLTSEYIGIITKEEFLYQFRPWETLKVLMALLIRGEIFLGMSIADRVGVVGLPEEMEIIRTTSAQFKKMQVNVLSLLSGGLVPFTSLVVDGLCDGNPVQQCIVCRKKVTVRNACREEVLPVIPGGDPVLVLGQIITFTLCGCDTCRVYHMEGPFESGRRKLMKLYNSLLGEHCKELCDYCGKLNSKAKGHRCAGCLTKLYCGVECQVQDTYHLQTNCENGEKRKKKRSDASRKEEGVKRVENL